MNRYSYSAGKQRNVNFSHTPSRSKVERSSKIHAYFRKRWCLSNAKIRQGCPLRRAIGLTFVTFTSYAFTQNFLNALPTLSNPVFRPLLRRVSLSHHKSSPSHDNRLSLSLCTRDPSGGQLVCAHQTPSLN